MEPPEGLVTGTGVIITFAGKTAEGEVTLASQNRHSLFLEFPGSMLDGYLGAMAVLWDTTLGEYRDLFLQRVVVVTPKDFH